LNRRPWVLSKSTRSFLPLRYYSPESLTAQNPLAFLSSSPRSLPLCKKYPRKGKGRRGLPVVREVRRGARLASGGPGGHSEVWLNSGCGRNRPVHVRRRVIPSAAGVPAEPQGSSSIERHDELHGMT
jgi:hypothetical protein